MKIKIHELKRLVTNALRKSFSAADARAMADVILFAELSGKKAHGVERMFTGYPAIFAFHAAKKPRVRRTAGNVRVIDGFGNAGMLLGPIALREVMKMAKKNGLGMVTVNGAESSTGTLSYYVSMLAKNGLIGIVMAQTIPLVAVHGGIKPVLGTNPFAIGIPKEPEPFVLDFSTTEISGGEVIIAKEKGQKLKPGVAIDINGHQTTSPASALTGAMLSFGDHYKSSGLAMAIEILAGALTGTGFVEARGQRGTGSIYIAIDPRLLGGKNTVKNLETLYKKILNSGNRKGMKTRIPGSKSAHLRKEFLRKGSIEIDTALVAKLKNA